MGEDDVPGGDVERGLRGVAEADHVTDRETDQVGRVGGGAAEPHRDLDRDLLEALGEAGRGLLALGARRVEIGQTGDEGYVVLAEPEGNEFCVFRRPA